MTKIPVFRGKVFAREANESYRAHAYQYATTSFSEGKFAPSFILYAADEDDLRLAIQYARNNDLAIAIRSGGHHYLGISSTNGRNIQVDLSGRELEYPENSPFRQWSIDENDRTLTLGVGLSIDDLNKICLRHQIFFPHGECKGVHVGGHVNTGGFSVLTRTYGAMIDYLVRFEIILADGTKRIVERESQNSIDQDLWFAVLGGSSGNFGIVTRISIRYLRDAEHPKVRGVKLVWPMTRQTNERLLQLLNELNDDPTSDPEFNLSIIALGTEHRWSMGRLMPETVDDFMSKHYPHLVGKQSFHWGFPVVALVGCWGNSKGADQDDSHVDTILERFRSVPGRFPMWVVRNIMNDNTFMEGRVPLPMSVILKNLTWENPRVMQLSYRKLLFFGTGKSLSRLNKRGITFAQWLSGRIQEIEGFSAQFTKFGLRVAVQAGLVGGPALSNPAVRTAMGNRDGVYWLAYDVFYNPRNRGAEAQAESYINSVKKDLLSGDLGFWEDGRERRLITGPIREKGEASLDEHWHLYYDSRADYERLLSIKARLDPKHVFTPNQFGVGAKTCKRAASIAAEPIESMRTVQTVC